VEKKAGPKKAASPKEPLTGEKVALEKKRPPERHVFPVVGIGASAGGLEPLEAFFATMPGDKPDMAFVVIQHLKIGRASCRERV